LVAAAATTHTHRHTQCTRSAVTDVIADGSLLHAAPHPRLYHLLPASFSLLFSSLLLSPSLTATL
jgi:hypothetical protein